ncbi:hypothetical protein RvY_04699-2 [Ramazzottius varieornatus]|uniref:Cyclic nucleotide-binding domain-containing protein n=1 Tax=Ramazzottius varieornatus TaxID=947166 RepID=A0A1D1UZ77_RAMVA|nr:hypothetical protein RvY_04699-2 [Ramazzottius varieornatus]
MLKVLVYWEFLDRIDQIAVSPWNYYFRVLRSVSYMMYLIHANACVFYYFSYLMDFDPNNGFVYNNFQPACQNATNPGPRCNFPGQYNAYIFCFFFSVSMVTIIGNLNFPGLVPEMIYSVILWFIGVFIFATIVGQIRDVLKAMTRHEDEFYEVMDEIVEHMHTLKIPKELQDRVRTWLLFNWEQQKTIDERHLLDGLPSKLRTDLAMEVHFGTIHKVQLFKEVDKKVLEELLVRLRPTVYLAGDYICRKGEIGKEMYIVKEGMLEVVLPDGRVAVTLGPGSVFGEISLLALAGGNRRTADVRSKGFTNLYVLTKADLNDVLKDYPETMDALRNKAHELMNKGKPPPERAVTPPPEEVIHTRAQTPEMVKVAISILKEGSKVRNRMYSQSAHELKVHTADLHDDTDDDEVSLSLGTATEGENGHVTPQPVADVTADMLMQEELVQKTELISPNTEEIISPSLEEQVLQEFAHNHEADRQSAGSLQPPAAESDSASAPAPRKSSKMRRKSRANHDADAKSSSDSDDNAVAQGKTSRRRRSRRSNGSTAGVNRQESVDVPTTTPVPKESPMQTPDSGSSRLSTSKLINDSPKERATTPVMASLTSLKRRFAGAPKVHPIEADDAEPPEPETTSAAERPGVFTFELTPTTSSKPNTARHRHRDSNISFSDYDHSGLSDTFAGVTFSSPDTP